jgi:uncharacterized protein (TIGR00251 family)
MPITAPHPEGTIIALKVVPGASRERVVGPLGDRLKVAVQKPPEKGAANKAVCALVAKALGVRPADVQLLRGETRPEKDLLVSGMGPAEVAQRLGLPGR